MELKDFTRGIAPKPKPVIQRPTGFDVQRSPYAPAPRVPAVAPTQSKLGSPSAVGFKPAYTPPANTASKPLFPSQFPVQGSMGATTPLLGNSVKPNSIPPFLLRTLPDFAVDATGLGIVAPPLGAAASAWGENAAQQYEMYTGDRKQKSPGEVTLAGALGLLPALAGVVGKQISLDNVYAQNAIKDYFSHLSGGRSGGRSAEQNVMKNVALAMQQPLAINAPVENAFKILQDGYFKNLHYPGMKSQGANFPIERGNWEKIVFGIPDAPKLYPELHPIYAYGLNEFSEKTTRPFGNVAMVLNPRLKNNAFYAGADTGSMGLNVQPAPYFTTDPEILRAAVGEKSGIMGQLVGGNFTPHNYTEAQIMGGVTLDDIIKILFTPRASDINLDLARDFERALIKSGIPFEILKRNPRY